MKANEIRIGNLVSAYNKIGVITTIEQDGVFVDLKEDINNYIEFIYQSIQPIPLTEEWLLKFGFHEKYKSVSNRWSIGSGLRSVHIFDVEDDNGNLSGKFLYEHYLEIKYVHQLQNLYFALTGEELTIKE